MKNQINASQHCNRLQQLSTLVQINEQVQLQCAVWRLLPLPPLLPMQRGIVVSRYQQTHLHLLLLVHTGKKSPSQAGQSRSEQMRKVA